MSFFKQPLLLLVFSLFFIQPLYSQSYDYEGFAGNVVYGTNGSVIVASIGKISYERIVINPDNSLNASLWFKLDVGAVYSGKLFSYYGAGFTLLTSGKENNHVEFNGGLSYFDEIVSNNDDTALPNFAVGYRYQRPGGELVFRTGLGFPDGLYASFGYAF